MVRVAVPADVHLLQQVLDDASGESNASIYGDNAYRLLLSHEVYLGFVDKVVVGCVMASADSSSAIIHNLAVSEQYRNRGHATTLVRSAMTYLNEPIERTYWAAADPANPSAVKRFHMLGFVPYQEHDARDVILMVRQPGQPVISAGTRRRDPSRETSVASTRTWPPSAGSLASND